MPTTNISSDTLRKFKNRPIMHADGSTTEEFMTRSGIRIIVDHKFIFPDGETKLAAEFTIIRKGFTAGTIDHVNLPEPHWIEPRHLTFAITFDKEKEQDE